LIDQWLQRGLQFRHPLDFIENRTKVPFFVRISFFGVFLKTCESVALLSVVGRVTVAGSDAGSLFLQLYFFLF